MSPHIDICVCTFRRPALAETLRSLRSIRAPEGYALRLIVVDNDTIPSAEPLVRQTAMPFPVRYLHAPSCNISIARNAGLDAATGAYLAFIDDDETVAPEWLTELHKVAVSHAADVVFGPAISIYPEASPDWLVEADYHSTKPPRAGAAITTGCSANVLMRRGAPCLDGLRFDPALGRSGGEDTVFFRQACTRGGRLEFAPDALVYEDVEPRRLSLAWLLRRRWRAGQSLARAALLTSERPFRTRLETLVSSLGKSALCAAICAIHGLDRSRRNFWLIRGALHLGTASRCLGVREPALYGSLPEAEAAPGKRRARHVPAAR